MVSGLAELAATGNLLNLELQGLYSRLVDLTSPPGDSDEYFGILMNTILMNTILMNTILMNGVPINGRSWPRK